MTEMTPKIEQGARAIAESCEGDPLKWQAWTHEARAAIEAMREPTPRMQAVGWMNGNETTARDIYVATIDEALLER